jgi:hypothetical protein
MMVSHLFQFATQLFFRSVIDERPAVVRKRQPLTGFCSGQATVGKKNCHNTPHTGAALIFCGNLIACTTTDRGLMTSI